MNKYKCHCSDTECILESNKRPTFCHYYSHVAPDWQLVNAEVPNLERWKPNKGETYCFIDQCWKLKAYTWEDDDFDNEQYEIGNVFQTYEQAKQALEKLKEQFLSLHGENEQ